MKTKNNIKFFFKKYFFKIRALIIILGTFIMFYFFYFSDKEFSLEIIIQNKNDIKMYVCILIAFGTSFFINFIIGGFNKENVKKMTSMKEFED